MRYVVRTVAWDNPRQGNVEALREQIKSLEVFTDHVGDAYALLFEVCRSINETGGVVLEDDVHLCRDFTSRLEAIVAAKGHHHVINFFERPKVQLETGLVGGSNFMWTQCVYLPPGLPAKIVAYHDQFKAERPKHWQGFGYDRLISYTLTKERLKYWRIRPTLVQHLPLPSVIGPRPTNRQTPYFIDDMEGHHDSST